jgi:crotonobetainyl-CoA:carnitine CoA-transferase CaiB-like acyl-CoA transferase
VHSFRGKVPEKLGLDYETLRAVNPGVVYQYAASYGSMGPYAGQPAIDPVIAAFAGQTAYQTGEGNPPLRESGADPVAAAGHAAAAMLGLFAQHRTGEGQRIESSMIVSNMYLNYPDAFSYEGKAARPPVDKRQLGTGATHRLYECAAIDDAARRAPFANPHPHWVMLTADDDAAFTRLCTAIEMDDLAADPRFATEATRAEHRAELEEALVPVFLSRTAQAWEARLLAAGVGCIVADDLSHFAFLYEDEQARAVGMMTQVSHPSLGGTYWRYAPVIGLSDTPARAHAYCDLGEHTRALLAEVGYADAEVERLIEDGVVVATA